jgi:hypothetical protein
VNRVHSPVVVVVVVAVVSVVVKTVVLQNHNHSFANIPFLFKPKGNNLLI